MTSNNKIPEIDKELIKSTNLFPVVGIGASAGGLDAFKKLLKAIPQDSGMAYVLVQHLDPNHESLLVEILQKVTAIPVLEIADDIKVQPNHIYILPSNKMMIANDGVLELSPRPAKNKMERNLPIDLFFTSLAEVHQSHAIGVVLSGTASDGTMGLKAIKDHGGITFAQDEESAQYEGMPQSAVEAGVVDFVLPPNEIPQKLMEVINIIRGKDVEDIPQQDEDVFRQILSLLRIRKGTDFTYYKQSTIRRRILRRMAINKMEEPSVYLKYLREKKTEQDLLYQDLLIPVTDFFRDPKIFDSLCKSVFPLIVKNKKEGEPVRIWVAGCSTGEEVYSMAICFKELMGDQFPPNGNQRVQIFATDLSEPAIAKARNGIYSKTDIKGLSEAHLKEYFTKNNGDYQAKKSIRDLCVFAVHNFLKDPAFSKMDFISCRNVLIYMEPYLQKKALTTFHYALNPKGFLLLGKSETTSGVPEHFAVCQLKGTTKTDKLFTRKDIPGRFVPIASQRSEQSFADTNVNTKSDSDSYRNRTDFQKTADDIMLSKYTPAGVVVNEAMDIVHFRGSTGNFLEPSPGKASLNLLKMAKEGLAFELRNILHKAKKENTTVVKENIPIQINGVQQNISIEAMPLPNIIEPHYMVLFHNHLLSTNRQITTGTKKTAAAKTTSAAKDLRIQQLEKELAQSREDMRSITEDQEAANEELQSANEELLSGSEELQSLNEEMETSKEELQSTNEELTVVNQEIIGLNEQVTEARDYAEAIISTLHEPLLVLDKHFRIKSANNAFYKIFQVSEKDTEGKLIFDLGNKQWNILELRELLQNILSHRANFENFEVAHNFPNIGERIVRLNARELINETGSEKLILLAIADITEQVTARKKIEESEARFRLLVMQAPVAIGIYKGKEYIAEVVNERALQMLSKGIDFVGKPLFDVLPELETQGLKALMNTVMQSGTTYYGNELAFNIHKNNISTQGFYNFVIQPLKTDNQSVTGTIVVATDVTEQVLARKKVEESEHRYHNMIYSSPYMIAIFKGKDTIIEIANDAIIETWGKGKDIIGKSLFEVLPEAAEQGFDKLIQNVYETGEPYHAYEKPVILLRNGKQELMHYNFIYQAQRNVDGEIEGVAILANEVTAQVEAKNKLLKSEKRFRNLVEQATIPMLILKGDNWIVELINEPMLKLWNVGQEAIGKSMLETIPEMKEQPFIGYLSNVLHKGITHYGNEEPAYFIRKNGEKETIYFNFVYQPYHEDDGSISGVMVTASDVTEQVVARKKIEESEQRYQAAVAAVQGIVWTNSSKGEMEGEQLAWRLLTGQNPEAYKGYGWADALHPDDARPTIEAWNEAVRDRKHFVFEHRVKLKNGNWGHFSVKAIPLLNPDGSIREWVGVHTDITEQKEANQRAEAATLSAQEAMKAKQQFLSNMSHEIRTPMNAIVGFTNVVLKTTLNEKQKEYINAIKTSGDSLIVLVNDILDLAKVDAGKMVFQRTPFKLSHCITTILHLFDIKIQEKNIAFVKEYDATIPEVLLGDPVRLQQIFMNLINNAIKFTEKGKITVSARLLNEDNEQASIEFSISDTGVGIAENKLNNIFGAFEQAHTNSSLSYGGTGLGLSIVKQLVEHQGGSVSVISKEGEGSTFGLVLPFEKTEVEAATKAATEEASTLKNLKILVAEDVKLNQLLIRIILEDFGIEVDMADNGKIAIEKLKTTHYDIVLMDLQMPEMDGFEATAYIRHQLNSNVPIIALTADVMTVDVEKCKAVGMNDYISKPIDEKLLYEKIIKYLPKAN
jgi:two-component system, chemotaxis family, CheB/CheR fusion protein